MASRGAPRVHFWVLLIGTIVYLLKFPGVMVIRNSVPEVSVPDMAALCWNTAVYLALVVVVFGHGLFWRSSPR